MFAVLDLGIDLNVWPWVWIGVAVVFAIIELTALAGSFVLLPFAVSAFAAALAGFYDAPVEVQWAIFFFGGGALFAIFWKYAKKFIDENSLPEGVGADRLVGMIATVTAAIDADDANRTGRVKVAGEDWGALTNDTAPLLVGSKAKIVSMNGTRVMVEAVVLAPPATPPTQPPTQPPTASSNPSVDNRHTNPATSPQEDS